jgi:hypothetical protein
VELGVRLQRRQCESDTHRHGRYPSLGLAELEGRSGRVSPVVVTLPPGFATDQPYTNNAAYCTFTVTNGSKKDIRAVALVVGLLGMGEIDSTLPAQ